jgi:hypothetical protein
MKIAADYQEYAEECLRWATEAKTEEEHKAFIAMARSWTEAALCMEGVLVPLEPEKPSEPPTSH